jgi:hypothetical protein
LIDKIAMSLGSQPAPYELFTTVALFEPLDDFWTQECKNLDIRFLEEPPRLRFIWRGDCIDMVNFLRTMRDSDKNAAKTPRTEFRYLPKEFHNEHTTVDPDNSLLSGTPEHFILLYKYCLTWSGKLQKESFEDNEFDQDLTGVRFPAVLRRSAAPSGDHGGDSDLEFVQKEDTEFFAFLWEAFIRLPTSKSEETHMKFLGKNKKKYAQMHRFLQQLEPFDFFVRSMGALRLYVKIRGFLRIKLFSMQLRSFSRHARDLKLKRFLDGMILKIENNQIAKETILEIHTHSRRNDVIKQILMKMADSKVDRGMHMISPGLCQYSDESDLEEPPDESAKNSDNFPEENIRDLISGVVNDSSKFASEVLYDNPSPFSVASAVRAPGDKCSIEYFVPFYGLERPVLKFDNDDGYDADTGGN